MHEPNLTSDQKRKIVTLRKAGKVHDEIAEEVGVGRDKVRRHLHAVGMKGKVAASAQNGSYRIGGRPEDREIIRLRDEVSRLKTEMQTLHRGALDDEELRRLLRVMGDRKANPPTWLIKSKSTRHAPEVPVTSWCDWHSGEVVSKAETNGVNEFNIAILKERVRKLVERTLRLADKQGGQYPGIVVNLLGDFVSGGLHPELSKTDEIEVMAAVFLVRDLLVWGLTAMADKFGAVYIPCTSGNHGRNTKKPEFKNYIFKNFDWMIYKLLEKHFEGDKRFYFDIPASNEVFYQVWKKRFLVMHGDMLGVKGGDGIIGAIGPIMRGEVKVRGSMVSATGDYDYLLIGHWHQPLWLPRCIVANSLKGYDEYAKFALRAPVTIPSQPLFFVHPSYGITSRWEIYLEGESSREAVEWVSVMQFIDRNVEM